MKEENLKIKIGERKIYIKSLSELIEYLENIKEVHGDVAVYKIFRENIEDFSDIITVDNGDEDDVYVEIG